MPSAIIRPVVSAAPPAANGTIRLIDREGKACASAADGTAARQISAAATARRE